MNTNEAIRNRRSIRTFTNDKISNEIIKDLIECARLAPSAHNRQPWEFYIVEGIKKDEITTIILEDYANSNTVDNRSIPYTVNAMKESPILILVLTPEETPDILSDYLSIGAAVENICLRATELNIGSLWIRDTEKSKENILKYLNIKKLNLACAISIGISNQNPNQRPRKELNEIIKYVR